MPLYELMCITTMEASASHVSGLLKKCGTRLQETGGIIRGVEHLGLRPLAYRMRAPMTKKYHEIGRYLKLDVQASPAGIDEFTKRLRIDDEMIRFLCLKQKNIAPKQERVRPAWKRDTGLDPALGDYLRRTSDLDFYAARTLLQRGKITEEEIRSLGKRYIPTPEGPVAPTEQLPGSSN